MTIPEDLVGLKFRLGRGEFADDLFLIDACSRKLSAALGRLQGECGAIGRNISRKKTQWMYLHNPSKAEMERCVAGRKARGSDPCCSGIPLDGASTKHVSAFTYLGSKFLEGGGVSADL